MIRVLIADDHAIVRKGLQELFLDVGGIGVAGVASNGDELLEKLRDDGSRIDLILLDLTMPGLSGIELIKRVRALDAKPPILVLSMHDEPQIVRRVMQAGVAGFVTKGSAEDTLIAAVKKVAGGGRFVDTAIVEQMMFGEPMPNSQSLPHERLSPREQQVMKRLARGCNISEIAEELIISDRTVSTHKARLMRKMNFQNGAELVRYAVDHRLID